MIDRVIHNAALALALIGGLALIAMTVLTVLSITGRGLLFIGLGPVPGAYELVEMGTAFAVFCFLPWCQLNRGHVTVDLFVERMGQRAIMITDLIGNVLLTGAAAIILWRLWLGLLDKQRYTETTFILGIPVWFGFLAASVGAALFVIVSFYTIWRSACELRRPASVVQGTEDAQ